MKNLFILLYIATFSISGWAHDPPTLGGMGGTMDRMGVGIAELGAGNTGTARVDGSSAAFWNPALLPFYSKVRVNLGEDVRFLSRNGAYAAWEGRLAPNLGAGLVLHNRGDFNVPVYNENEEKLGIAKPQEIAITLGVGVKTSRYNSFGASMGWYNRQMDLGGVGNTQFTGIIDFGWYRRFNDRFQSAFVIRNIGLNTELSARYESQSGASIDGFSGSSTDFFPKTAIASVVYTAPWQKDAFTFSFELLDYLLMEEVWDADIQHNAFGTRLGVDYVWNQWISVRGGWDRGNMSTGASYTYKFGKRKMSVDYAILLERNLTFLNPFAIGLRLEL